MREMSPVEQLTYEQLIDELQLRLKARNMNHVFFIQLNDKDCLFARMGGIAFLTSCLFKLSTAMGNMMKKSPVFMILGKDAFCSIAESVLAHLIGIDNNETKG